MGTFGTKERMAAMERLYKAFYNQLFLFARTFLNNDDEAHDIVSGVFETVWLRWQQDNAADMTVTAAYLLTLTRNRCVDLLRHDRARRNYADLMLASEHFDTTADVEEYETSITRLREAVSRLPEPGRTILYHCYFKRMSYQETADHLKLSLVVVRKNMLKAFKILRETLNNTNDVV